MSSNLEVVTIPVIVAIVYGVMAVYRQLVSGKAAVWTGLIPVWAGILGMALGIVAFYVVPEYMPADNILMAVLIGLSSGLTATGADQVYRQIKKSGGEA